MAEKPLFIPRLVVIGVGLIGGSLAAALKRKQAVGEVVGVGRNLENLQTALDRGLIDRFEQNPAKAVQDADLVLLATPVCSTAGILEKIKNHVPDSAILTDVGSIKQEVINAVKSVYGFLPGRFVPGHPIAGAEKSGAAAADADLFLHRKVVLTPEPETDPQALEFIRRMWRLTGAQVSEMPAQSHDEIFAATSHLPHMLAYALVSYLLHADNDRGFFNYAAGGFADFTRIASSDPAMWRDVALCNRDALLDAVSGFEQTLSRLKAMIEQGDGSGLYELFDEAKSHRDDWLEKRKP